MFKTIRSGWTAAAAATIIGLTAASAVQADPLANSGRGFDSAGAYDRSTAVAPMYRVPSAAFVGNDEGSVAGCRRSFIARRYNLC